jgi:cell filamentation protein
VTETPIKTSDNPRPRTDASRAWQAYQYPKSQTLRNKLDIHDREKLESLERTLTSGRLTDLSRTPHTPEGYKSIHKHLFQDVYEWAGQSRTVEMHRSEQQPDGTVRRDAFIPTRFIEQGLATTFNDLKPALDRLRQEARKPPEERNVELVAKVAASHVGALNFVHAFRDGNGRTMRAQVDNLAQEAGLRLNEQALDRAAWNRGSHEINADPKNTATLARTIAPALEPRERAVERQQAVARGIKPPDVPRHARDVPGPRQERDYGLGD